MQEESSNTEYMPILGSLSECLGILELGPDCSTQSKISKVWLALQKSYIRGIQNEDPEVQKQTTIHKD